MAPPCYADLGKQARDIFNKNYHFSLVKLDCKTKTDAGIEFCVNGSSNLETSKVCAALETKYKVPEYGMTLKEKWNTDNILQTELTVEDKLLKGFKVGADTTFAPHTGKKAGVFKSAYKMEHLHMNTDVNFDVNGPVVHSAAVLSLQGWLAGAQASFDTTKSKLTKTSFAFGYAAKEFVLHTNVNDGQEFGCSIYQKVNPNLETGVQLAWCTGNNSTRFGLGCVYSIDDDTSLRVKINNASQIGLGITHRLKEGIQLTLSSMIDAHSFNQGGHKIGLGLDLEA